MNYEQIILDIVSPLVHKKDRLRVILLDQENLHDSTYMIYCDESDVARLIGKKGVVAEAIYVKTGVNTPTKNKATIPLLIRGYFSVIVSVFLANKYLSFSSHVTIFSPPPLIVIVV